LKFNNNNNSSSSSIKRLDNVFLRDSVAFVINLDSFVTQHNNSFTCSLEKEGPSFLGGRK
jgi:hypothetical protein